MPASAPAPGPPLRRELRAVHALVLHDLMRLTANPSNALLLILQPLLYLYALGGGLSALVPDDTVGGSYRTYLFPGVLLMSVQAPAMSVGIRLIIDRDSGILREILTAPARRTTLLCGMCLGGCTSAAAQGAVLIALAPAGGLPYEPLLLLGLLTQLTLITFTLTAISTAIAVRTRRAETFTTLLGLTSAPFLFTSGAFVPRSTLPTWLEPTAAINPLAYASDALHGTINALTTPAPAATATGHLPLAANTAVLLLTGLAALLLGARAFNRNADGDGTGSKRRIPLQP
ncbi:ABC transporter permease [Streptomyces sp. NPDC052101]|uniref:ABC transporter permease n=1 Tax=Streptomyces sp. NPDC052101 TaxID=3155763 RepID=UPI00343D3A43